MVDVASRGASRFFRSIAAFVIALIIIAIAAMQMTPATAVVGAVLLLCVSGLISAGHPLGVFAPTRLLLLGGILYILPTVLTVWGTGVLVNVRLFDAAATMSGASYSLLAFSVAALGSMVVGSALPGARPEIQRRSASGLGPAATLVAGLVFVVGMAAVGVFVFGIAGIGAIRGASYGERYQLMAGQGFLILGVRSVVVATIVLYAIAIDLGNVRRGVGIALAGLGFQVWWMGLMGARSAFIQAVIGLFAVRQALGRRLRTATLVALTAALVVTGVIVGVFRAGIGNVSQLEVGQLLSIANPANSEFGATLTTIGDVVAAVPAEEPFRYGRTYLDAIGLLVPKFMWPDRPRGASEWYVDRFYPMIADDGGGFAFSPVAEAYLNFGRFGVVTVFLVIGAVFGLFDWLLRSQRAMSMQLASLYGVVAVWVVLFSRLDAATFLKTVVVITLGQVAIIWAGAGLVRQIARLLGRSSKEGVV